MAIVYDTGLAIEVEAGENIGGNRLVVVIGNKAFYADNTTLAHAHAIAGITIATYSLGDTAIIKITPALMLESSWTWTPDASLFATTNGFLSHTVPTSGFVRRVAFARTATLIQLISEPPIIKA